MSARLIHWLGMTAAVMALTAGTTTVQASEPGSVSALASHGSDRLAGAWRLVSIDAGDGDGSPVASEQPTGMLIYTADGHMSVQLMYPPTQRSLTNVYVLKGYEASFGTYTVDATTVTHHVIGANTGSALVGRDLRRHYRIDPHGDLVITPEDPKEHWSVTWRRESR